MKLKRPELIIKTKLPYPKGWISQDDEGEFLNWEIKPTKRKVSCTWNSGEIVEIVALNGFFPIGKVVLMKAEDFVSEYEVKK